MTALRRPDGAISSLRRVMEKFIYIFYSELFDNHVHRLHAISRRMDMSSRRFSLLKSDMPSSGEESYSVRSQQDSTQTFEESTTTSSEHIRSKALHAVPVGMQGT
ncbi:hypothetical protein Y032_0130g1526 [Ancylostoma ceylanicum]|nr:hypothetical protein Y032_0130g1526 [Ancylostoma ceylanicum]